MLSLAPPVALLTVIIFVLLVLLRSALRALRFNSMMKSLAAEYALHYTHPVKSRPPTVNGFYRGREVVVDTLSGVEDGGGDYTRVRVFHKGEVNNDFTVEGIGSGGGSDPSLARNIDAGSDFISRFRVTGADIQKMRKYLDSDMQGKILAAGLPFTVGKYCVTYLEPWRITDKVKIVNAMNFLVDAAVKADTL